jgi:hypothetical protein
MALKQLTRLVYNIQRQLLPALQEALGPLSPQEQRLVQILELLKLEKHVDCLGWKGTDATLNPACSWHAPLSPKPC